MKRASALRAAVLWGFLGPCACSVGGVTSHPLTGDAALPSGEEVQPDRAQESLVVNLDVPGVADSPSSTCITIDGSSYCVATTCGNGIREGTEECDDGNTSSGEGCTSECKQESDWICPTPGAPCVSTVVCGDRIISGNEVCDDFNTVAGDGCSADCRQVEPGWSCPAPGVRCQPKCGDGLKVGGEDCDDGNTNPDDGCSSTCKVEAGYACSEAGKPCHATVCGDGKPEGDESCDDGNTLPSDGCTMECKIEPQCTGTDGCTSPCGDALKLPEEECDDGNTLSSDGCSAECKLEAGWACEDVVETTTKIPIYYRDMMPSTATTTDPPPHPNFEVARPSGAVVKGIVMDTLGDDRTPVYNPDVDADEAKTTNAEDFDSWYHDSGYSKAVIDTLEFTPVGDGTFVYDNSGVWDRASSTWTTPAFFPLDDRGWATPPDGPEIPFLGTASDTDRQDHNFGFTSEVRYWFEYQGGEKLDFTGDDDVFVFLNGKLAVDLGGVHLAANGSITLDEATAAEFNLTLGKLYEIVVFQAERRVTRSSYKLTLGKFNRTRTVCTPRCGDGVVNGSESCDEGPANSDTAYGGCTTQCEFGPFCGDGTLNGPEECDDGANAARYGMIGGCGPGCHKTHYCGDSQIDSLFGEECDNGPMNGQSGSLCTLLCRQILP